MLAASAPALAIAPTGWLCRLLPEVQSVGLQGLEDIAITASDRIAEISDGGLRRLFDRLVELGAVREQLGRPTFRICRL